MTYNVLMGSLNTHSLTQPTNLGENINLKSTVKYDKSSFCCDLFRSRCKILLIFGQNRQTSYVCNVPSLLTAEASNRIDYRRLFR